MTVAQGYVFCGCLTAAIVIVALWMIGMGVFRRGEAAELDDGAAYMLIAIGGAALVALAAAWAFGLSDKIH
ncbi:MAG: hypothetical protein ABI874_04270 [Chloroflexota bacterium]